MPAWQYPFLWIAAGFAGGILAGQLPVGAFLAVEAALVGMVSLLWLRLRVGPLLWAIPTFAAAGYLRARWSETTPPNHIQHLKGQLVRLQGYTIEEPLPSRKTYRLLIEAESVYVYAFQRSWRVQGRCLLYVRDSAAARAPIGSAVQAIVRLDSLRFGQAYWRRQGVEVSAYADSVRFLGIARQYLFGYIARIRLALVEAMRTHFPGSERTLALLQALVLGYKRGVDPETRAAFQLSGTAHILAVSGMHVGLVLTLWLFLLRQLPGRLSHHWLSQSALIGLVVFYGFLTGASPSAMRAVLMGTLAILARMMYKPYAAANALGIAAFLQLCFQPNLLYEVGFQLSYAAVGGILVFYPPLQRVWPTPKKAPRALLYVRDLISISVAAQAGTFFLSWAYFGRLPLYFLLANLFAVPLATGLTFAVVGWLAVLSVPGVGVGMGWILEGMGATLLMGVQMLSQLPGGSIELPPIAPWMGATLTLLALGAGSFLHRQKEETSWIV